MPCFSDANLVAIKGIIATRLGGRGDLLQSGSFWLETAANRQTSWGHDTKVYFTYA
ncbi:hypothetical protein AA15237_2993 [Komagataeibacter xylinus NBRC 15237]|nr:hypothetical protein AA15237_2993 [Komagataeibacter xylinus NBRC 15237]